MVAFHGQMGMFTRALAYILSHGADGLSQVAEDAVLNANYVLRSLEDVLDAPFARSGPCMHEAIFSDKGFEGGVEHDRPRKGADRRRLPSDDHVLSRWSSTARCWSSRPKPNPRRASTSSSWRVRSIAERAKAGDQSLKAAPVHAPRRRLDETLAARKPVLTWRS